MNKFVITGSPGCGKSSIIRGLEISYNKNVIREAAEDFILYQKALGIVNPRLAPDFQSSILELLIKRESKIPVDCNEVFLDRGVPDVFGYLPVGSELYDKSLELATLQRRNVNTLKRPHDYDTNPLYTPYTKVFVVTSLGIIENTDVRCEDHINALEIGKLIFEAYTNLGYEVVMIPKMPLTDRIKMILSNV